MSVGYTWVQWSHHKRVYDAAAAAVHAVEVGVAGVEIDDIDGLELVEEAVTGLADLAVLARGTDIPLVADESVNDPGQAADALVEGSCSAVTVKLSKIGGLNADLGGHLPTYLSSALDGPVGIAAAAHVAQTLDPTVPWPGMAHGLAQSGADVCIWGTNTERNDAAVQELSKHGTRVRAVRCDVSDEAAVDASFAETLDYFGRVDSCFANAGRPATGTDLAHAVAFLLSPDAQTISGTVIDVGCFAQQGGPLPVPA